MNVATKKQIPAGEFKAKCLYLMEVVKTQKTPIIITKRGIPIAQLTPIEEKHPPKIFGYLKDSITIEGDIISPIEENWEAENEQ